MSLAYAHLAAAVLIVVFFSTITLFAPEPYLGYFSGYSSWAITLLVNLALSLPYLALAQLISRRRRAGEVLLKSRGRWILSWGLFAILVVVTAWQLRLLWLDQFFASRGFGVVAVMMNYGMVWMPIWIGSLCVLNQGRQGAGSERLSGPNSDTK